MDEYEEIDEEFEEYCAASTLFKLNIIIVEFDEIFNETSRTCYGNYEN